MLLDDTTNNAPSVGGGNALEARENFLNIMITAAPPPQNISNTVPSAAVVRGREGLSTSNVTYSRYVNGSIFSVPSTLSNDHAVNDSLVVSVYAFVKAFLSSAGTQGAIDNRIEQAMVSVNSSNIAIMYMDLVKSHLMTAVKSEVEELKERISGLEESLVFLQRQNETLRPHVPSEVLEQVNAMPAPPAYLAHQEQTQLRLQLAPHSEASNGGDALAQAAAQAAAQAQAQATTNGAITGNGAAAPSDGGDKIPPLEPQN